MPARRTAPRRSPTAATSSSRPTRPRRPSRRSAGSLAGDQTLYYQVTSLASVASTTVSGAGQDLSLGHAQRRRRKRLRPDRQVQRRRRRDNRGLLLHGRRRKRPAGHHRLHGHPCERRGCQRPAREPAEPRDEGRHPRRVGHEQRQAHVDERAGRGQLDRLRDLPRSVQRRRDVPRERPIRGQPDVHRHRHHHPDERGAADRDRRQHGYRRSPSA